MQSYGVKPWVKVFPRKHTDFSEWYREVLFDADVLDQRFPLKGCNVWKGYGTKIMDSIMNILEDLLDESDHEKTYFPLLIPEDVFGKESKHLKGFEDQVFWVNRAGANETHERDGDVPDVPPLGKIPRRSPHQGVPDGERLPLRNQIHEAPDP